MKLRYYMRGLGIGIIVTALIMGIAAGNEGRPLTDAEIRAAALKLGMVESDSLKLTDIQPVSQETGESLEREDTQEDEGNRENGESQEAEESRENEESQEAEESPENGEPQEAEESPENEISQKDENKQESETQASAETGETVTITVQSGSGSRTVCNQLAEAGLIEDAAAFDRYLIDNGYSKRICVGTYEIEVGTDKEQIAKIITRTR